MGKYSAIIHKLPKTLGTDPSYQDKINTAKLEIISPPNEEHQPITIEEARELAAQMTKMFAKINSSLLYGAQGRRHGVVFAQMWRELRRLKDLMEDWESDVNLLLEAYAQLIVDQYEVEGSETIKLSGGDSVSVQDEPVASVTDRDALREWAINNDLGRSLNLPWQTLNAIVKERLLKGLPEPPGVKAEARSKCVFRRGKGTLGE